MMTIKYCLMSSAALSLSIRKHKAKSRKTKAFLAERGFQL
jgi:hypothetical protein